MKFLTFEELIAMLETRGENFAFDGAADNSAIGVRVPAEFELAEPNDGLLPIRVKCCHTGVNRNKSSIDEDVMRAALNSIKYRPLLAYIHTVTAEDGTEVEDFAAHEFDIVDGEMVYLERQIGCFTADEPTMELEGDRYYVYANAVIPEDYTSAADIIRRKGGTKVSVELAVNSMSYDVADKVLVINGFTFAGCTMLGCDADGTPIEEGMEGARADIATFDMSELPVTVDVLRAACPEEQPVVEEPAPVEEPEQKFTKSFEISHSDIRHALYVLLEQFEVEDNDYYYIEDVYDDYFVFGNGRGTYYRIGYSVGDDDVVSFAGDRTRLYAMFLTEEEKATVETARANYDAAVANAAEEHVAFEKASGELDTLRAENATLSQRCEEYAAAERVRTRDAILARVEYDVIRDDAEFVALASSDSDNIADAADLLLAKFYKTKQAVEFVPTPYVEQRKPSPYGTLFK